MWVFPIAGRGCSQSRVKKSIQLIPFHAPSSYGIQHNFFFWTCCRAGLDVLRGWVRLCISGEFAGWPRDGARLALPENDLVRTGLGMLSLLPETS